MTKCPYCGIEIQDGATICWVCQRRQVIDVDDKKTRTEPASAPPPLFSFAIAILLLLTLALVGVMISEESPEIAALFALIFSLFLGWMGARGRYTTPTLRQYLVTMLIALVPVLGTAYAAFFTGRYLAQNRMLRISFYLVVFLSILMFVFWSNNQGKFDYKNLLVFLNRASTSIPTAYSSAFPSSTPLPPASSSPTQTSTSIPTPKETPLSTGLEECIPWSSVTMAMVGQNLCVNGDYFKISQKQDQTYVLSFSDETGTFQVWSYPKPFEPYLSKDGNRCVVIRGWIITSGVRPIVVIGPKGKLEPCPSEND